MEIAKTIAPFCLIIIMFGLGLGLTVADFTRLIKIPRDFIVGFFGQVILLPIVAFILIQIISLPPELALGTMIIAAAPGGVMSNILTKFANGDVALSVSLTAVVSIISVITVPLIIYNSAGFLGIEITKEISMLQISIKMFFAVTVPVIFGMIVRSLMTDFVISKTLLIQRLSLILFLIVFCRNMDRRMGQDCKLCSKSRFNCTSFKSYNDFFRLLSRKIFSFRNSAKKMYFTRMWPTKRNFSIICWNTTV